MKTDRNRPWWLLPPLDLHPAWWIAVGVALLGVEYATGIYAQFPLVYVIPVSLAAWYSGRRIALALAVAIPIAHFAFAILGDEPVSVLTTAATVTLRGSVITFMALWIARLSEHERDLHREVQALKGLLPICSFCKSIKNETGKWEHLERFITRRSATTFSHGVCPTCQETYYANLGENKTA